MIIKKTTPWTLNIRRDVQETDHEDSVLFTVLLNREAMALSSWTSRSQAAHQMDALAADMRANGLTVEILADDTIRRSFPRDW